jgi:hypothetical protein
MRSSRNPVHATRVTKPGNQAYPSLAAAQRHPQCAHRIYGLGAVLIAGIAAVLAAPSAHAEDSVTYEIVSDQQDVPAANVEYNEGSRRKALQQVPLPWRLTVDVPHAVSPANDGAEIRADWRPYRWPYKYVTVRIYLRGTLLCESTLDVGDATCYGSTPHRNFPQTGGE